MLRLSKPYIPTESLQLVGEILQSGHLIQGKHVETFERLLSEYLEAEHVIVVSSGTAALHLSLVALGVTHGDEVIVPAYSFPAVANVVELVGAKLVFVDISLDDLCIDVKKIEERITSRTKAIIPVHEFGQSADILEIINIARRHRLYVIEDAACAIGSRYNDINVGTFGDLGCFSFHPRKILTTGEGGAITTQNSDLADILRKLRNHGMQKVEHGQDFILPGYNYRMTDFQAAIGNSQMTSLPETIDIHRLQAEFYHEAFKNSPAISLDTTYENRFRTFQTYHILLNPKIARDTVKHALLEQGIESNIGAYAIPYLSYYQKTYNHSIEDFKNALTAYQHGLALPIGRHLTDSDLMHISNSVNSILAHGF